ncbi:MAG: hypothetical protein RIR11_1201 [Bacteroidota bacterium]|jgi:hypothetical protein
MFWHGLVFFILHLQMLDHSEVELTKNATIWLFSCPNIIKKGLNWNSLLCLISYLLLFNPYSLFEGWYCLITVF